MFKNRKLIIATMHEKERVMAYILEDSLGVNCITDNKLNTDVLGTFTGEIERENDPISTLRNKCLLAMSVANCDLAIGSEGSFGMHPAIFFAPANDELIMLLDKKNDLEIIVRELSTDTNFNSSQVGTMNELIKFAESVQFPTHGLIMRKTKTDKVNIIKGICDWDQLSQAYEKLVKDNGFVYVETDMRAMFNPSRMNLIEKATLKLVEKIKSLCPNCNCPGFGVTSVKKGLPCEFCYSPTQSSISHIHSCIKCEFIKEELFPNNKKFEEQMYCDICNP